MSFVSLFIFSIFLSLAPVSTARDGGVCGNDFHICQPSGATQSEIPAIGPQLSTLYLDLLESIKSSPSEPNGPGVSTRQPAPNPQGGGGGSGHANLPREDTPSICCAEGTKCLTVKNFNVPACYDSFTTNFILVDGSYGTLDNGTYHALDATVYFLNGTYTSGTVTGNIYGTSAPPSSATLPIPTPYTAAGVGSAIPIDSLGAAATITTTIPGTTIAPSTVFAQATTVPIVLMATRTTVRTSGTYVVPVIYTTPITTIRSVASNIGTTIPGTTVGERTVTITSTVQATRSHGQGGPVVAAAPKLDMAGLVVAAVAGTLGILLAAL